MDAGAALCVVTSLCHDPTSGEPFAASSSNDDMNMWRLEAAGGWSRPSELRLCRLPRRLPGPHAARRGHLLLQREDGITGRCVHTGSRIAASRGSTARAGEKVLVEGSSRGDTDDTVWPCGGGGEKRPARVKRETVVPIMGIVALPLYHDRMKKSDDERFDRLRGARIGCTFGTEPGARGGVRLDAWWRFGTPRNPAHDQRKGYRSMNHLNRYQLFFKAVGNSSVYWLIH